MLEDVESEGEQGRDSDDGEIRLDVRHQFRCLAEVIKTEVDDCKENDADPADDSVCHETVFHRDPDSFDVAGPVVRTYHRSHPGRESQFGEDEQVHDIVHER